jgi:putative transposase
VPIGRDKMFEILGAHKMLVEPKKSHIKTTYSKHSYAVAPNRIKELTPTAPNQVFVADITYIHTLQGVMYLFLVTDLFSRKIVGYDLRKNLMHHGAIRALEMALEGVVNPVGIIHHSDRGSQYCCHEFLAFLSECGMSPSMTDADHCYQNAVAERVNGILKLELYIDATFRTVTHAQCAVKNAIKIYNTVRTHFSLNLKTPQEVYAKAA